MSDYFFQDHVAEYFHEQGYPFYALDLRRCGRSRQRGERWHYTRDMSHYFPEITKAVQYVAQEHGQVVLLAHSTGGLIAPLWADEMRRNNPEVHELVAGIILNSPWLDLQFPKSMTTVFKPVINTLGKVVPLLPLPGGSLTAYGKSLHYEDHGSWSFNKQWKPISGHRKYFGWMRAVLQAQAKIHSGSINAGVPTLVLHSSHSFLKDEYTPAADTADTSEMPAAWQSSAEPQRGHGEQDVPSQSDAADDDIDEAEFLQHPDAEQPKRKKKTVMPSWEDVLLGVRPNGPKK